jgi:hypothetical protein
MNNITTLELNLALEELDMLEMAAEAAAYTAAYIERQHNSGALEELAIALSGDLH